MIINWTGALRNGHFVGGDYARYMRDIIRVYTNGGLELHTIDSIVAFEIEVASRMLRSL